MNNKDIRWIQRFNNYTKALIQLENGVNLAKEKALSDLEKQGLIQSFEFTHELAWNVMKDFFKYQGNSSINGSRDATREAFNIGLVEDGHIWMEMIESRNKTSHTYNEKIAEEIIRNILDKYFPVFIKFKNKMKELKEKEENL